MYILLIINIINLLNVDNKSMRIMYIVKTITFNKCANERKLTIKPSCFLKFLNKNGTNKQKLKDNCKSRI